MRVVIASCSVDYSGRLDAHLPRATRLIMVKADGSVLVHSDGGSYKPLNWMSPPARLSEADPDDEDREAGVVARWEVAAAKTDDRLVIRIFEILSDASADLGVDPGLTKDGVEAHLQELLAEQIEGADQLPGSPRNVILPLAFDDEQRLGGVHLPGGFSHGQNQKETPLRGSRHHARAGQDARLEKMRGRACARPRHAASRSAPRGPRPPATDQSDMPPRVSSCSRRESRDR